MKLIYPHDQATPEEIEEILRLAIEGRKRVKDQILRIDATMAAVKFGYDSLGGGWSAVTTLEEDEYPTHYHRRRAPAPSGETSADTGVPVAIAASTSVPKSAPGPVQAELFQGQRDFVENQRGISYETLLMPYMRDVTEIELHDPYIRMNHQGRNLVELLALMAAAKDPADEITVNLFTVLDEDPEHQTKQLRMLNDIVQAAAQQGIKVNVAKDPGGHDRWIRTDTGWRINLGHGLDIFQKSDGGWFDFGTSRQEFRQVRAFGVTYIREDG
ncbi:hypothetical protein BJQ90_03803 [Arthrobacter sp. SO3]|nr:hypothetical protein [Arthrobacter sp. SO3]